ncbi:MAG TPA: penicillin acylase family protein, partial [Rhodospirillales bacterium]|nr:penicillin acylase family protein [Rhodospirillales bacterium]
MPRWSKWVLGALLIVAAGLFAGGLWLASSASPTTGRRVLTGLGAPAEVLRDRWGVPHIFAASEEDAVAALGWVHAEDRLAQMETTRRTGAGRLAEVIGPSALPSDRWMRTLGLYRLAEQQYARLSERSRGLLDAYARGVNAWLATHDGPLPPEFLMLGITPEPWTVADSLVWLKLMALRLSVDRRDELLRARLAHRLSPAQLAALWPDDTAGPTTIGSGGQKALLDDRLLAGTLAAMPEQPGAPRGASNAWVVSGGRTATGAPILASDPHLGFALPSTWYLARIVTPYGTLAGATAPGFPAMVFGRNDRIAWGITSSDIDVEDVFVDQIDPADSGRYLAPGGPLPFVSREETISVRGQDPEMLPVRLTRHGPVISDLAGLPDGIGPRTGGPNGSGVVLALAATSLAEDDRTADALFDLARTRDVDGFLAAAARATAPQQNVFYADVDGRVGFVAAGRIPVRPQPGSGLPVEGWSGANDSPGFLPFEAQPQAFDPPSGVLVNANNRPAPPDWPYPIDGAWDAGFRAARISDVLAAETPQTPAGSAALQTDAVSLMAWRLLPPMLAALPTQPDPSARRAVELLRAWRGEMRADAPQPLLFAAWLRELVRVLAADELGPAFVEFWDYRPLFVGNVLAGDTGWCNDVTTPAQEDCAAAVQSALDAALAGLSERFGPDPDRWRWGDAHVLRLRSMLWSRVPVLGDLLGVNLPLDGGNDTPLRAASRLADPETPFAAVHGAGFRGVYDLADLDASRFVIAGGQSGNPLSRHWRDLVDTWKAGGGLRLAGDQETLRREAASRLQLLPGETAR